MPDLKVIEAAWCGGMLSQRAIARKYGIAESTLRHYAEVNGWVRNPAVTKRKLVSAAVSGVDLGAELRTAQEILDEVNKDVTDMERGLNTARAILVRVETLLSLVAGEDKKPIQILPKDLKILSECIKLNVETIRQIRELDAKPNESAEEKELDAKIDRGLAQLKALEAGPRTKVDPKANGILKFGNVC